MNTEKALLTIEDPQNLHLCFSLDKVIYALNAKNILEITNLPLINGPQKLPENIIGIINYNDMFINVINIRKIFNFPQKKYELSNKVIIIKGEESLLAIIADEITDFFTASPMQIQRVMGENYSNIIKGFFKIREEIINIIEIKQLEDIVKKSQIVENSINYTELFPQDEESFCILQKRKNEIAKPPEFSLSTDIYGKNQYVLSTIKNHTYCIYSLYIKELVALKNYPITPIPYTPEFIKGIINLKGDFYTVIDLKNFIDINEDNNTENSNNKEIDEKIMIIESNELKIAFLVDNIIDIINIPTDFIEKKNDITLNNLFIQAEACIDGHIYNILNVEKLINDKRIYIDGNN